MEAAREEREKLEAEEREKRELEEKAVSFLTHYWIKISNPAHEKLILIRFSEKL